MTRNLMLGKDAEISELHNKMAEMQTSHDEALSKAGDDEYDLIVEKIQLKNERNQAADTIERQHYTILNLEAQLRMKDDMIREKEDEITGLKTIISKMEKDTALLKSKNDDYEEKAVLAKEEAEQAEKDAAFMRMLDTGLDTMVYHLGFCSDVLGDSWAPEYEKGGLAGIKKSLRESSKYVHGKNKCSTCDKLIGSIHD